MLTFNKVGSKPSVPLSLVQFGLPDAVSEGGALNDELEAFTHLRKSFPTALITRSIQSENDATFLIEAPLEMTFESTPVDSFLPSTPHRTLSNRIRLLDFHHTITAHLKKRFEPRFVHV